MITINIPKNGTLPNIGKELNSANQIKDRYTRLSTVSGLKKISHYL